jgi:hypothetical protein
VFFVLPLLRWNKQDLPSETGMAINNGKKSASISKQHMTHTACERRPWGRDEKDFAVPPIRRQIEEEPDRTKEIKTGRGEAPKFLRGVMAVPSHMYVLGTDLKQETNPQGAEKNSKLRHRPLRS